MATLKIFDLGFADGQNTENRIYFTQGLSNAIPFDNAVYPLPQFISDANLPQLNVSAAGAQISYKIQNNNLILANGDPQEAFLMVGIPSIASNTITIDVNVAFKPLGGEIGNYGFFNFDFSYTGRPVIGTIKGLTAFGVTFSAGTDTFYVGFIGAIASYNWTSGAIPTEGTSVTVDPLILIDLAVDNVTELIYFITKQAFYVLNFGTTIVTPINLEGLTGASNFVSIATDDTFVYIAATLNGESIIVIYEIATGTVFEEISPFSDTTIPFNKIIFERGISNFAGTQRSFIICSNGGGAIFSLPYNGTAFLNKDLIDSTTQVNLLSDVINDVSMLTAINSGGGVVDGTISLFLGTSNGYFLGTQVQPAADTIFIEPTTYEAGKNVPAVQIMGANSLMNISVAFIGVISTSSPSTFKTVADSVGGQNVIANFKVTSPPLVLSSKRVNVVAGTNYWLGTQLGQGVKSTNTADPGPPPPITTLSDNYDLVLQDIIKSDTNRYYFLVNEVGSSDVDANAVLLQYDSDINTLQAGQTGYFLPTDKLWLAGDVFLLRNLETPSSFFYKTITNLNLNETSGASSASQDEGLINTTEAGNLVDIIYTKSLFYLLGTRGIEVWQNQGASGFPYRKESYLTIPYHLLPLSDQNLYKFELNRWAYFEGGYLIAVLSNEDNEFQIISVKGGKYELFPLNKAAWYAALNTNGIGAAPQDLTLNVVNMWGKEYIIMSKIDSRTVGTAAALLVIDGKGRISGIGPTTEQTQFLTTTSTNGVRTRINAANTTLDIDISPQLATSLSFVATNTIMQSRLLQPLAENVLVTKIIIQYAFPIADVSNYPNFGSFFIFWSRDEGRTFSDLLATGIWTNHLTTRQLVYTLNITVPSFMIQFVSDTAIIIEKAIVSYEEVGLR